VLVDGLPVTNPRSLVAAGAAVTLARSPRLRGSAKLRHALDAFAIPVAGRVAVDVGAAAGGFTTVLVAAGATRVYAVDAGHGQLAGWLRQHPRVVNLEATNLGQLDTELVPDVVDLVTIDVSYLSLAAAVPQLDRIAFADGADLVALVKPQFELRLPSPPTTPAELARALAVAITGIEAAGWSVVGSVESPVTGARGAREHLVHARRQPPR